MYFSLFLKLKQKYDKNMDFFVFLKEKHINKQVCKFEKKNQIKKLIEIHNLR